MKLWFKFIGGLEWCGKSDFFVWLVIPNKILTWENLKKKVDKPEFMLSLQKGRSENILAFFMSIFW